MNLMASKVIQQDKDNNMKISLLLIFLFLVFVVEYWQEATFNTHLNWALFILFIAAALGSSKEMNYEN